MKNAPIHRAAPCGTSGRGVGGLAPRWGLKKMAGAKDMKELSWTESAEGAGGGKARRALAGAGGGGRHVDMPKPKGETPLENPQNKKASFREAFL